MRTLEYGARTLSGWGMLVLQIGAALGLGAAGYASVRSANVFLIVPWALAVVTWAILMGGFYTLQPNQAAVLVLFGKYRGTDRASGFRWANPFFVKIKVSLRA